MIKQLKRFPEEPTYRPPATPVCCAEIVPSGQYDRDWRLRKGQTEPFTCQRDSVVEVDGKTYCRLHGGHKVLDMYLKGELIRLRRARDLPREPDGSPPVVVMVPAREALASERQTFRDAAEISVQNDALREALHDLLGRPTDPAARVRAREVLNGSPPVAKVSDREERLLRALLDIAEARAKNAASGFPMLGLPLARWMEDRAQREIDR